MTRRSTTIALIALATGERVVRIAVEGKTVEYGQANIQELRNLRAEIAAEVQTEAGRRRFVLTSTDKGL